MLIAYWIIAGLASFAALAAGAFKLLRTRKELQSSGQKWTEDFTPLQVKLIGAAEVLGAIGLILPMLTRVLPVLSPIAAIGIALIQVGAFITHARRGERPNMVPNLVIFALAGTAAALGFFLL